MKVLCPICELNSCDKINALYDDRYGYKGIFDLYRCTNCLHKFLDHSFTLKELGDLYSNYYPRSSLSIDDYKPLEYKKSFLNWLNGKRSAYTYVPKNVKVLDIGCGFGESLGYHKERGCDVFGVDADENIKRVAEKYGFNAKVGLFDKSDYSKGFFDFVTMDQVLEHTTNPIKNIQGISEILKKDGVLIVTIPNSNGWGCKIFGNRWINWHAPYHLHHFSKKSIYTLAKKANLEVKIIKTITSSEWLHYQWLSLVVFPKMGQSSAFWSFNIKDINIMMRAVCKVFAIIHRLKINHILTRFFDSIDCGDNYLIVLKNKSNI